MASEWIVIRLDAAHPAGYERYQTDGKTGQGMPKLLELAEAEAIQARLNRRAQESVVAGVDPPPHAELYWRVNHYVTLTPPREHQDWLNRGGQVRICEHCGNPVRP